MAAKALSMNTKLIAALADSAAGGAVNVAALCRELGMSRKHYYVLKRRFASGGVEAVVAGESRRPHHSPAQVDASVEERIVRWRKELISSGWHEGARTIRTHLAREGVVPLPAVSTIHKVLRRNGLVADQPSKRPRSAMIRFEYDAPNACWQLDGMETRLADGTTVCVLVVNDDHSRKVMKLLAAPGETTEAAWGCTEVAITTHGPPARMLSDRGAALNGHPERQSEFRARLRARGIQPISSRGYHPQTCGKNERSHQDLQKWLAARLPPATIEGLQVLLDEFTELFNSWRPHQALNGHTPDHRYNAQPKAGPLGALEPERCTVTTVTVSARGEVRSGLYTVQAGRTWQGARVTIMRQDLNIVILSHNEVIRRLVIDPTKRYQGNGRPHPRSPKPHPRKVLPMS
jgi:transposase InsO family protein